MKYEDATNLNIFLDTNAIYSNDINLFKFELNGVYNTLKDFIEVNEYLKFKIIIPKIVIEESKRHYIEKYEENIKVEEKIVNNVELEKNKEILNSINIQVEIIINKDKLIPIEAYINTVEKQVEEYINMQNIKIADIPITDKSFKDIIKRAINKDKPFFADKSGTKKFTDAGFKDVLFLESIKEYMFREKGDCIIITNDRYIEEVDWKEELSIENVKIISNIDNKNVIESLCGEYNIQDFSKILKFARSEYYKEKVYEAIKERVIEIINIEKIEPMDDEIGGYFIENKMEDNSEKTVVITEENEFIAINDLKGIVYTW